MSVDTSDTSTGRAVAAGGRARPAPRNPFAGRAPAPAPPAPATALHSGGVAAAALLALVAVGAVLHEPVLIPPIAASAAIVYGVPALPLAQPRSVVAGHLLCAAVGYLGLALLGSAPWVAALGAGVAVGVMTLARTPHSPAAATTVVVVLQAPDPVVFVPLLAGAAVLLVLAGMAASRARRGAVRYPVYWW
ncbi:HPP family protein [Streptomyces sp. NPDC031705]|uniref:HPP family protein n=1 Tax=Streptomyces sp. NPDC031705 TaxID=3155729 RepID=UPI0033D175C2